jgi:Uma2 family endonuclease
MVANTLISESEYLSGGFPDPTPEYVCGELIERAMPNRQHSRAQGELYFRFRQDEDRLRLHPFTELRVCVAPGHYRIGDLFVYAGAEPTELVPPEVPLVAVEIVSPDDRYEDLMTKLAEYEAWGVRHIWLADPGLRRLAVYSNGSLTAVDAFELPEYGLRIEAAAILR